MVNVAVDAGLFSDQLVLQYDSDACGEAAGRHYSEPEDKLFPATKIYPWERCRTSAIVGRCSSGHQYAKSFICGSEQCATCGEYWSAAHRLRFKRWLPKARQVKEMGYFVLQWPILSRPNLDSKKSLSSAHTTVKKVLTGEFRVAKLREKRIVTKSEERQIKSRYWSRGLRRWHWYGDPAKHDGYPPWNPHLNVLVPGGYMSKRKLDGIKSELREALGEPNLIVNYQYTDQPSKMIHMLKYVTRPTFTDFDWWPGMAIELIRFRNQSTWGVWKDAPVWGYAWKRDSDNAVLGEQASHLEFEVEGGRCTCPACGGVMDFTRPKSADRIAYDFIRGLKDETVDRHDRWRLAMSKVVENRGRTEANVFPMDQLLSMGAVEISDNWLKLPDIPLRPPDDDIRSMDNEQFKRYIAARVVERLGSMYPGDDNTQRCYACGCDEFWQRSDGGLVCQCCHPEPSWVT